MDSIRKYVNGILTLITIIILIFHSNPSNAYSLMSLYEIPAFKNKKEKEKKKEKVKIHT